MREEFLSGLFLGTLLGIIGFIRIAAWTLFHWSLWTTLVSDRNHSRFYPYRRCTLGNTFRIMLPMLLKRMGFDRLFLRAFYRDIGGRNQIDSLLLRLHSSFAGEHCFEKPMSYQLLMNLFNTLSNSGSFDERKMSTGFKHIVFWIFFSALCNCS